MNAPSRIAAPAAPGTLASCWRTLKVNLRMRARAKRRRRALRLLARAIGMLPASRHDLISAHAIAMGADAIVASLRTDAGRLRILQQLDADGIARIDRLRAKRLQSLRRFRGRPTTTPSSQSAPWGADRLRTVIAPGDKS